MVKPTSKKGLQVPVRLNKRQIRTLVKSGYSSRLSGDELRVVLTIAVSRSFKTAEAQAVWVKNNFNNLLDFSSRVRNIVFYENRGSDGQKT